MKATTKPAVQKRKGFSAAFFVLLIAYPLFPFNLSQKNDPLILAFSKTSLEGFVSKVVDGDTIVMKSGDKVRYIGIDTPEYGSPFFFEAKERNRSLVNGKKVRLEICPEERRDQYGRLLAFVYVNDQMVNRILIKEGLASLLIIPPCGLKVEEAFKRYELEAINSGIGLWRYEGKPISHLEAGRYLGKIKRVSGKIISSYNSGKALFLNYGDDYKRDFTVVIFAEDIDNFTKAGINPENYYKYKESIVIGRIKAFNGPEIIVRGPEQIKIVER